MKITMTVEEFAAMVRYIVETEKKKPCNINNWKIPAIKTLRSIKFFGLKEAKDIVEACDSDPVVAVLKQLNVVEY